MRPSGYKSFLFYIKKASIGLTKLDLFLDFFLISNKIA